VTDRTLVITNDFPPRAGGIQSFVHGLVERQPPGSMVVFAPKWSGSDSYDAGLDFPVVRYPHSVMLPTLGLARRCREIARSHGCTRVLFGATAPLGLLAGGLRRSGIERIVGITHGHEAAWASTPGSREVIRRIGANTDTITYLGDYTRNLLAKALDPQAAARMRRLVPGVDAQTFSPALRPAGDQVRERYGLTGRQVIVCVSRLMPRKGQDTLIHALPTIRRALPEAALLIVGGGPYRKKLDELVVSTNQQADIVITGSVPFSELPAHYAAGEVFAMPCRTRNRGWDVEGLGIVYLEASSTGIPVVSGDSGGAPDAVVAGKTGCVVPGGSPVAVARPLIELLSDPPKAEAMGAAGRAWIESDWKWTTMAARLESLLSGVDPDLITERPI
jgi:phosphatidylinositol alpha-1,6-mannosyltransferase